MKLTYFSPSVFQLGDRNKRRDITRSLFNKGSYVNTQYAMCTIIHEYSARLICACVHTGHTGYDVVHAIHLSCSLALAEFWWAIFTTTSPDQSFT